MKGWIFCSISICFFAMMLTGSSQSADKPVKVSLMVDMNMPATATDDQMKAARVDMINIYNEASTRKLNWTVILTQDASSQARLFLAQLGFKTDTELMASGNHSDEKLSAKSYSEQNTIIKGSVFLAGSCKVCNVNEKAVNGFMPQSFDQNEDTYKALDDLGIEYDAGFQSGILYTPGHENDVWPYKVANHNFYAVPVSTFILSGEKAPLYDRYVKDKGLSSSQWKNMLVGKFDEALSKDEPMIVSLSSSVSGSGGYLDALKQFMDYAISKQAKFVTVNEIVTMSKTGVHEATAASTVSSVQNTASSTATSACPECDAAKKASQNVTVENGTIQIPSMK
jgi:hypothetical protein